MRVYYDRLVDDADKSWLFGHVKEVVSTHLKSDFNVLFQNLDFDGDGKVGFPLTCVVYVFCLKTLLCQSYTCAM